MKTFIKIVLILFLVILISIQFVPVDRINPPVTGEITAPAEIMTILEKSCFDCHSNETKWPWYAYVAPISWPITQHVRNGRDHLNFSEWDQTGQGMREKRIAEVWEEVEEDHMPIPMYKWIHRDAVLSEEQKAVVKSWVASQGLLYEDDHTDGDEPDGDVNEQESEDNGNDGEGG